MDAPHSASNPFMLMMHPEVVLQALETSERLSSLKRRVCRPLDKPLIPRAGDAQVAYDLSIDAEPELDEPESAAE